MAIRPRVPAALRNELGVDSKRTHLRYDNREREPRKKRKLYQAQTDEDDITSNKGKVKSILKRRPDESVLNVVPKTVDDILMERDDAEIDYWEAKLGQKKGASQDELDDGLDDLFSGLDLPRGKSRLQELDEDDEDESDSEEDTRASLHEDESQDELDDEVPMLVQQDDDDFAKFDEEEVTDPKAEKPVRPSIYKPYAQSTTEDTPAAEQVSAYVPPALRNKSGSADATQLQRQLKGQINRLSAVNIATIVKELEAMYRSNPRGLINDTIASHLMDVVSDKSGLRDSFVILHAALVAALYKLHGTDFGASFVQRLVEGILDCAGKEMATGRRGINLMGLMAELYNFNIVSATLPYDFIRLLLAELNELNVEILLEIIKSSGTQLRSDDPSSLKDILSMLQAEMKRQHGDKDVPLRMRFMVESLLNLKNNKISTTEGQQAKELRTRMKKYIGGLVGSTGQAGYEPLRVTLDDIRNIETRGKWWLVGASWREQDSGKTTSTTDNDQLQRARSANDAQQEQLQALARKHRLNNPIRKQIFITILSSSDYLEAITSILSLRLKKAQESEITRVLVLLVGSEERYNPFYTHIAKGLSDRHGMRISLQFCLWDFLRDCGETEVGQIGSHLEDGESAEVPSTRKIINVAKFFGALLGYQVMPLTVFKTLTFSRLHKTTRLFLDVLLSEMFLVLHSSIKVTSRAQQQRDFEKRVAEVFGKVSPFDAANGTSMTKGVDWFLRKVVVKCGAVLEQDRTVVQEGVEIARIVLSQS